jgi:spore coat polysaccharide biosynthesis protein SpsF
MKAAIIIQARMGSKRLPGKTFIKIGPRTLLDYLVESFVIRYPQFHIWIATSIKSENDVIRKYAEDKGIYCYSGDDENVASRYMAILKNKSYDYFFRICGDTPYYGTELIDLGVSFNKNSEYDIISTLPNKGFPMGCNLELINSDIFQKSFQKFNKDRHFEHVTTYFYENLIKFRYKLITCNNPDYQYDKFKFSIDNKEDLKIAEVMLKKMDFKPWNFSIDQKLQLQLSIT